MAATSSPRPELPAFAFPALPVGTFSITTTPAPQSHPRRQHRRSAAISTSATRSPQRHAQFYPPVPPLPVDLSVLSKPTLARPSPRKSKPSPLNFAFSSDCQQTGTFLLGPSRPASTLLTPTSPCPESYRAFSISDASTCPTLVSCASSNQDAPPSPLLAPISPSPPTMHLLDSPKDPASGRTSCDSDRRSLHRRTRVMPMPVHLSNSPIHSTHTMESPTWTSFATVPTANAQPLPAFDHAIYDEQAMVNDEDDEEEEDDDEFWSCIGAAEMEARRKSSHVAIAEWMRECCSASSTLEACHTTTDDEVSRDEPIVGLGLEIGEGGWIRACS